MDAALVGRVEHEDRGQAHDGIGAHSTVIANNARPDQLPARAGMKLIGVKCETRFAFATFMLMKIADDERLTDVQHTKHLPPGWRTPRALIANGNDADRATSMATATILARPSAEGRHPLDKLGVLSERNCIAGNFSPPGCGTYRAQKPLNT
jgi:hypothetical protein